jgi:hypothetical protein
MRFESSLADTFPSHATTRPRSYILRPISQIWDLSCRSSEGRVISLTGIRYFVIETRTILAVAGSSGSDRRKREHRFHSFSKSSGAT